MTAGWRQTLVAFTAVALVWWWDVLRHAVNVGSAGARASCLTSDFLFVSWRSLLSFAASQRQTGEIPWCSFIRYLYLSTVTTMFSVIRPKPQSWYLRWPLQRIPQPLWKKGTHNRVCLTFHDLGFITNHITYTYSSRSVTSMERYEITSIRLFI